MTNMLNDLTVMHKTGTSHNRPDSVMTTVCKLVFGVFVCSGHGLVSMAEKRDCYRRRLERRTAQTLGRWVRDVCDRCWHQLTGGEVSSGDIILSLDMTNDSDGVHLKVCSLRWAERKRSLITGHGLPRHHITCWTWDSTSLVPTHQLTGNVIRCHPNVTWQPQCQSLECGNIEVIGFLRSLHWHLITKPVLIWISGRLSEMLQLNQMQWEQWWLAEVIFFKWINK